MSAPREPSATSASLWPWMPYSEAISRFNTLTRAVNTLRSNLSHTQGVLVSTQDQANADAAAVDALTTQVNAFQATLSNDVAKINAEIAVLQGQIAAGEPIDLTGLESSLATLQGSVTGLGTAVSSVDGIAPPAAPPAA